MKKLLAILGKYWLQILILIAFTIVQVSVNLRLPDYLAKIINEGIVQEDQDLILRAGVEMLGVALIGGVATIAAGYLSAKIGSGFSRDLREKLFTKIQSFSLNEFNKYSVSSLITRSTNDIQQVQMVLIMIFRMVLSAPITGVSAVIKAYDIAPSMSWIMALAIGILFSVIIVLFIVAVPKFELLQKLTDKLNLVARENLTGIRVIRAFNTEKKEQQKFTDVNDNLLKTNLFVNRAMSFMQPLMMLVMNLTMITIIWVGAHLIADFDLEIGNMMAFMQYSMQAIIAFLMISIVFIIIPRAAVSIRRINEILNTKLTIKECEEPQCVEIKEVGEIEFKDVCFQYNEADECVLSNINFTAKAGETTAIVGGTGSGKSTLINLIPRFFDATRGEILIDGVNIKDITQEDLHNKIGYIPQKAFLFSGTIESNIKYGNPKATEAEIAKAAEIAQASEFIEKLPDKFKTDVSQSGTNLSGGQKQRLSIARALVRDPEIIIFDDSFSALDFKTDAKLRQALEKNLKGKTIINVAQRISTIMNADKIVVLNEGKIAGIGRHLDLLRDCKVYREIAQSQLSEEELSRSTSSGQVSNMKKGEMNTSTGSVTGTSTHLMGNTTNFKKTINVKRGGKI